MKMPQLFVRVGPDKFVPVEHPREGEDIYEWDSNLGRIVLQANPGERISTT